MDKINIWYEHPFDSIWMCSCVCLLAINAFIHLLPLSVSFHSMAFALLLWSTFFYYIWFDFYCYHPFFSSFFSNNLSINETNILFYCIPLWSHDMSSSLLFDKYTTITLGKNNNNNNRTTTITTTKNQIV